MQEYGLLPAIYLSLGQHHNEINHNYQLEWGTDRRARQRQRETDRERERQRIMETLIFITKEALCTVKLCPVEL